MGFSPSKLKVQDRNLLSLPNWLTSTKFVKIAQKWGRIVQLWSDEKLTNCWFLKNSSILYVNLACMYMDMLIEAYLIYIFFILLRSWNQGFLSVGAYCYCSSLTVIWNCGFSSIVWVYFWNVKVFIWQYNYLLANIYQRSNVTEMQPSWIKRYYLHCNAALCKIHMHLNYGI